VTASNAADVLNLVGFATGTALYAMLLVLVLRGGARGGDQAGRKDRVPLATAVLGLAWNLGELASYALPRLGIADESVGLSAVPFPALGVLAAVVVHSVARDVRHGRLVVLAAYALSLVAAVLHARTILSSDPAPSTLAFQILTVSFGVLIVPLAVLTRYQPNGRRALWMLALALVAVSATHLGSFHTSADSWWMQLVGHHAAIPLAFAILYQDYRFALGDLFLKQALTLLAIVGIAVAGYSVVSTVPAGPAAVGLTLALWVTTALVAPLVRRAVVRFVDAVLLGRVNYAVLRQTLAREIENEASIAGVMHVVCSRLAGALNARRVWWSEGPNPSAGTGPMSPGRSAGAETPALRTTVVPTTEAPHPVIHVSELTGGRRLLSDDEALFDAAVGLAARRVDAIRLRLERYETELREEEMQTLAAEAELRALRAQINPHFLFNALTTIGYLIETAPPRALATLMRLTALLRGVLRPEGVFTTLGRELELVEHYLDIERERFEERLRVRLDVPEALGAVPIPALIVQPLVENAIKHGVAPSAGGGEVELVARGEIGPAGRVLRITVRNTGAPLTGDRGGSEHLGLDNVKRRLAGHYGPAAALTLGRDATGATIAELCLPLGTIDTKDEHTHAEALAGRAGRR